MLYCIGSIYPLLPLFDAFLPRGRIYHQTLVKPMLLIRKNCFLIPISILHPSGASWARLGLPGLAWTCLGHPGHAWATLWLSGAIWSELELFGASYS